MSNVVELGGRAAGCQDQETARVDFWKRRQAAGIVQMLPDKLEEALEILDYARRLLVVPLSD